MIAIAGPDIPRELLIASGRDAGPVRFDPDRAPGRAADWLESKFAPWAMPVLDAWAEGAYDGLEAVLFSRSDDTSQRLYYYLCELQRLGRIAGPEPLLLDSARIPRPASLARTVERLRVLVQRLGIADAALEAAIARTNAERGAGPAADDRPACLLTGTAPPDGRLHAVIADAGFRPVGQTLAEAWCDRGAPVAEGSGDPVAALGRWMHERPDGPRGFRDPVASLAAGIAQAQARAVVLWRVEEDEAQCWHLPQERAALAQAGVPALVLTRRDWRGRDGAGAEIAGFLQGIAA
ncbi:hypothetical protein [Croceibacterium mercuriale]|uniref:hypothetical protein n=1 Tax=Croceibacterium mercuriale TaxID=1572751 RepID=UPI0009DD940A|nr:hypothetical protein [Croceibacterium mercuriale]